jgi:signal transduction histidine kinase
LDDRRQWFKARVGLETLETSKSISFCSHAIHQSDIFEVENALADHRFFDNPLVSGHPDIRFYAGMPLTTSSGFKLGTLCVIDSVPRHLTPIQRTALEVLSHQVIRQLELRISKRKLEIQSQELAKLNETNAKILTIIGHDLRSPLASLSQVVEMSQSGDLSPDETIELVKMSGFYIESSLFLLENLINWAQQQFRQTESSPNPINLSTVVSQISDSLQMKFKEKGNRFEMNLPQGEFQINENVFSLLLRNLLTNANKFTRNGIISVKAIQKDSWLEISVKDTGIGMDDAKQTNLFNWEKRKSTDGTSGEKGIGIGLILCKEMVEIAGGKLSLESKPGFGTTFTFTLPTEQ